MEEQSPFVSLVSSQAPDALKRRYLRSGKIPLALALEDAARKGISPDLIQRAEERGMLDGSLAMTYEGAQRLHERVRARILKHGQGQDYLRVLDSFDPVADHDLVATAYFCLDPTVRQTVQGKLDTLYRIVLYVGAKERKGYALPVKQIRPTPQQGHALSHELESLIALLPREEYSGTHEYQRRLRVILEKKAEREIFPTFKRDTPAAFTLLESRIAQETNDNLREVYSYLKDTYKRYVEFTPQGVNPRFRDPETGAIHGLPSLHQRIALHHISEKRKFGIFDGCGTGKTAIATLAQPLFEEQSLREGRDFMRTVIVGPNSAKKAWKRGLMGDDHERYLAQRLDARDVAIIDGSTKDNTFLEELRTKPWIVLNYEQLITQVNGTGKLFVEWLVDVGVDYVIFDESHHIKGRKTTTARGKPTLSTAAQFLAHRAHYLVLLSGSPIPDKLSDYAVPCHLLNPALCPNVDSFDQLYEKNPRILYTLFNENTLRRTSEELNDNLSWKEHDVVVSLDPLQQRIYDHIVEHRPDQWLIQARKALLDPRLVDPALLRDAGVLGHVTSRNSGKYAKLEELLTSPDGPLARDERFIVFSSMFREGVTQQENRSLRQRYEELGVPEAYEKLELHKSLNVLLEERLREHFSQPLAVGVIDGTIVSIEERERIVDRLHTGLAGIICTTETGGESLDFTRASAAYFLDEDYTPKTAEQAIARLVRRGQTRMVSISHLVGENTLDEDLKEYVERKNILSKIATDGYPLTPEESQFIDDTDGKQFASLVKRRIGGKSIDVLEARFADIHDFEIKRRKTRAGFYHNPVSAWGDTTEAQAIAERIGRDKFGCWYDPDFVAMYLNVFNKLSVPVVQRAKILTLAQKAKEGMFEFPRLILSEAAGNSVLYAAYQELAPLLEERGIARPTVIDRDLSLPMLRGGNNPRQIVGCMTGKQSAFRDGVFDMVENGSLPLLRNPDEVHASLLEAHRILKPDGLVGLVVKNQQFLPSFYDGMERLGFDQLNEKNQGFVASKELLRRLKKVHGEHYAESYASKLGETYFILGQKKREPQEVNSKDFWFAPLDTAERRRQQSELGPLDPALDEPEWKKVKKARAGMLRREKKARRSGSVT